MLEDKNTMAEEKKAVDSLSKVEETKTEAPKEETSTEETVEVKNPQTPLTEEEPKARFSEQTPADKRLGYSQRKAEKGELDPLIQEIKGLRKDMGYDTTDSQTQSSGADVDALREEFRNEISSLKSEQASEKLLGDYITANPQFKGAEDKIRKYMNNPAYLNVPISFIAKGLASDEVATQNAQEVQKADEVASTTEAGGSTSRKPVGKYPDFQSMSTSEFEAYTEAQRNIKSD